MSDNIKNENLGLFRKLAMLQREIKVLKNNENTFANFKYRTIDDMLSELKPLIEKLDLFLTFQNGKVDGKIYKLDLIIINLDDDNGSDNIYINSGEILIDENKQKMDLSQKVLSAKTFLKKTLLEDLLLLNNEKDPDSHNNTGNSNNTNSANNANNTQSKNSEDIKRKKVQNILYFVADKDKTKIPKLLKNETSFKNKDGDTVAGVESVDKLTSTRLNVILGKLQKKYPEISAKVKELLNKQEGK